MPCLSPPIISGVCSMVSCTCTNCGECTAKFISDSVLGGGVGGAITCTDPTSYSAIISRDPGPDPSCPVFDCTNSKQIIARATFEYQGQIIAATPELSESFLSGEEEKNYNFLPITINLPPGVTSALITPYIEILDSTLPPPLPVLFRYAGTPFTINCGGGGSGIATKKSGIGVCILVGLIGVGIGYFVFRGKKVKKDGM